MGKMNQTSGLEGEIFEPVCLHNDDLSKLNSPNPELALEKTHAAYKNIERILPYVSYRIREVLRKSGYPVPPYVIVPEIDFGTADLPQTIVNDNGRLTYKGIAMRITRGNGQRYQVDVNPKMAGASEEQFEYKALHEDFHAILDAYDFPMEKHDLYIEQWIDIHAAEALGKPELVETSKYITKFN